MHSTGSLLDLPAGTRRSLSKYSIDPKEAAEKRIAEEFAERRILGVTKGAKVIDRGNSNLLVAL